MGREGSGSSGVSGCGRGRIRKRVGDFAGGEVTKGGAGVLEGDGVGGVGGGEGVAAGDGGLHELLPVLASRNGFLVLDLGLRTTHLV